MLTDDLLWRHLKRVPAFRALLRATESLFYQELELPRPILDLGCGDGDFARTTFENPPEVGIDPWLKPLREARDRQVYRLPIQAAGYRLPFADGQFGTVICNSVLEHIQDVQPVIYEVARVLQRPTAASERVELAGPDQESTEPAGERPAGVFVMTVPSEHFTELLSISTALRGVGLEPLAVRYEGWFNQFSRHRHCDPPAVWHERLGAAGLSTVRWQYYFSRSAHARLEWGNYLGLPALVSKLLLGHWVIAPWRSSLAWTERLLRPWFREPPPKRGAYLVFVAWRLCGNGEIAELPWPAPRDYSLAEPEAAPRLPAASASEQDAADESLQPPAAAPAPEPLSAEGMRPAAAPLPKPLSAEDEGASAQSVRPPAAAASNAVNLSSIVWLVLALLCATAGQTSWNWQQRPLQPGDGFTWYGLALLWLGVFVWQTSARRREVTAALEAPFQRLRGQTATASVFCGGLFLSWLAWRQVGDAARPAGRPALALLLWLAGIGLAAVALWPGAVEGLRARLSRRSEPPGAGERVPLLHRVSGALGERGEVLVVVGLFLVALLLRFWKLDEIPYVLAGDEASMGREAVRVASGDLANPFVTGWFSHPTLYYFLLALPIRLFGQTALAVRFLSPFAGALTVAVTYVFARRAWGRVVALLAAALLAGYHFHIHYSRLGLNNIWDPLFALLVMGLLWRGWQSRDRRYYLAGGLGLGLSQYFYMGSRMLLVLVAALVGYWLLTDRRRLWEQAGNLAAALLVALVVALPIALFSVRHPDDYMARMNQLGIYQSGWMAREIDKTGRSHASLLWEQFWKAGLAFNYTVDPTFWYRPGIPLLRFGPSILFVFGLLLTLLGIRRTPNFLLLLWIGATMLFAGVLLENPPSSQRYVIAAPAACLLVALALAWMAERLRPIVGGRQEVWLGGLVALGVWMAWGDVSFYFREYTPTTDYGGVNTEVAQRTADYLLDLGPGWRAYFFGAPWMAIEPEGGFPSVAFLAPEADTADVPEAFSDVFELPDLRLPAVFIFLPNRAAEMEIVRGEYPGGIEKHFPGRFGRMLFTAYEVR